MVCTWNTSAFRCSETGRFLPFPFYCLVGFLGVNIFTGANSAIILSRGVFNTKQPQGLWFEGADRIVTFFLAYFLAAEKHCYFQIPHHFFFLPRKGNWRGGDFPQEKGWGEGVNSLLYCQSLYSPQGCCFLKSRKIITERHKTCHSMG